MENIISYYYNLSVDNYKLINNVFIIESNHYLFIAKEIKDLEMFKQIISINSDFYMPLINKDGEFSFEYNNKKYTLFKADNPSLKVDNNFKLIPVMQNVEIDYSKIWINNIDYFIKKITEMEHSEIEKVNHLNYYIGMSENAVIINEKAKKMSGLARITVSHYRICYPNYALTYNDPTELTFDFISRDLAEYIKTKFFFDKIDVNEVIELLNRYNINDKEIMFFLARLLYPTYYFDAITENNIEKQKIIIEKREKYENFLSLILNNLKTNNIMINISWLK